MGALAISIDVPPGGEVATSGGGTSPTRVLVTLDTAGTPREAPAPAQPHPTAAPKPGVTPGSLPAWAASTGERALFTFVASLSSALALGGAFSIPAADAALFAAASAALSVVTAAIRSLSPPTDDKALDVVTRVGLTLLQAFTAAFVTSTAGAAHFADWRAGALAGLAGAFTALKGTVAVQLHPASGAKPTPASLIPLPAGPAGQAAPLVSGEAPA
jgi:hypothetical protein